MSMRILWVRHAPLMPGLVTRDVHLLPRIARRNEVHVVTWEDRDTAPRAPWRWVIPRKTTMLGLPTYVLPHLPRPPGWPHWLPRVNQPFFRHALRELERRLSPHALVVTPSWSNMGYPPPCAAARVFDWLDGSDWRSPSLRDVEQHYLDWCDGVMAVSEPLAQRVRGTSGWQEFGLYRVAPQSGTMTVTFALTGLGEAWLDDVTIQTISP